MMDATGAWIVARLVAGVQVEAGELQQLEEPWASAAEAIQQANGKGRITAFQAWCTTMANGEDLLKTVLEQDPRKTPKRPRSIGLVPTLPGEAYLPQGAAEGAAGWLDQYTDYAKCVSPLTPGLFHEAGGLWLVSLAIARRLVLRMAHKDVYPNLAILQIAPTTLYAKSTGLGVPRFVAGTVMRYLLLPGEMTPEAMIDELAGKEPQFLDGIDMEEWQKGKAYAGQRGMCLDEASSLFAGLGKDYQIGMGETLLRLYDCDPHISRQTRGTGRATVRNSYFCFLGATTPWHLRKADVDSLWHTGIWARFMLLTPDKGPSWCSPSRTRTNMPRGMLDRLQRLIEDELPESRHDEPADPISVGLGEGVFDAYSRYLKATMHDLLTPPTSVDRRLFGVYGRLAEQALKISMLLSVLDWGGNGAPVITIKHWARAQQFCEACRASAHRLPGLLSDSSQNEEETKVLMWLDEQEDEWATARDIYRALNMASSRTKTILLDLMEADLVEQKEQGRATYFRIKREDERMVQHELS
jgi:hypothetical protein